MGKRNNNRNRPGFLAQMLIHFLAANHVCQGTIHQQHLAQAAWEVRMYQDFDAAQDLLTQGVPSEQINQLMWDMACKEQDTTGIVTHKILYLCSSCVRQIASLSVGEAQAALAMMAATLTSSSFLLASDRLTENAVVITNLTGGVQESDLREQLQRARRVHIHFKKG